MLRFRCGIALLFILFIFPHPAVLGESPKLELFVAADSSPVMPAPIFSGVGERQVLIPAQIIGALGGQIDFLSPWTLRFRAGSRTVMVEAGQSAAAVDENGMPMGGMAISRQNFLFLPLLFVAELLDMHISWEQDGQVLRLLPSIRPKELPLVAPTALRPTEVKAETEAKLETEVEVQAEIKAEAPLDLELKEEAEVSVINEFADAGAAMQWRNSQGQELAAEVWLEDSQTVLLFKGVSETSLETWMLPAPPRLVIDTTDFLPETMAKPWILQHPWVKQVRVAPYQGKGRIVLDLEAPLGYQIEADEDGVLLRINRGLRQWDFSSTLAGGSLRLDLPAETPYEMVRLTEPERLVIDLMGTTLLNGAQELEVDSRYISTVRGSQFDQHTVRLVLDLAEPLPELPLQLPRSNLEFVLRSEINTIDMVQLADGRVVILVEGQGPLAPELMRLREPERVVLDIGHAWPTADFEKLAGAGPVRELRMAQFSPQVYRVVAELEDQATVSLVRFSQERVGMVIGPASLAGLQVAVDAGHGGVDPGAIGRVLGITEASINFDIAEKLRELLTQGEAIPIMVRPGTDLVPLVERPQFASEQGALLFVSIHCNSAPQKEAAGTETLYSNLDDGSMILAAHLQAELIKSLGTKDRGIKREPLYVLRMSETPAALVEVAFLSNSEEEKKLADEDFRQKAAEGIYRGLLRYVTEDATWQEKNPEAIEELLEQARALPQLPKAEAEVALSLEPDADSVSAVQGDAPDQVHEAGGAGDETAGDEE